MLSNSSYKFKRGATMEKRIIQGIGLIVLTPDKKILVIEEMKDKPILEKKSWDAFFSNGNNGEKRNS